MLYKKNYRSYLTRPWSPQRTILARKPVTTASHKTVLVDITNLELSGRRVE